MTPVPPQLTFGWGPRGWSRRLYRPGDEARMTLRADFAAQAAAAPGLPEGPKWTLTRGVGRGLSPVVAGVGGVAPGEHAGDGFLWGLASDLDARGWAAVRAFVGETALWAERTLGALRLIAVVPAHRPEAAALLARLDFEVEGPARLQDGSPARMMIRRRD